MVKVVTHSGSFHADDVCAVATILLYLKREAVTVLRTRDAELIAGGDWVVDVGGVYDPATRRFDHHQLGAPVREGGMPYAAFGLVWKELGVAVCGSEAVASRMESLMVQAIDAGDNGVNLYDCTMQGVAPFELYQVIGSYAPAWGSEVSKDEAFLEAVAFAQGLLTRLIAQQRAAIAMEELVYKTYQESSDKRVLVFDVPVSSLAAVQYPEVEVVVCPDDPATNQNWSATAVRQRVDQFASRVLFPEAWAGLRGHELVLASSIQDAVFCHTARFIFVAGSKAGALAAAAAVEQAALV